MVMVIESSPSPPMVTSSEVTPPCCRIQTRTRTGPASCVLSQPWGGRGLPLTIRATMTNMNAIAAAATATLLVGCATPTSPPVGTTLQPEQVVRSLSAWKLTARGDPDAVFGLAMLKTYLQPAPSTSATILLQWET